MSKYNIILIISVLVAGWAIACKKNTYFITERTEVVDKALLKAGYFAASITNQPAQLKVNGQRLSPNLAYNTPFPGGGLNTGGSDKSDFLQFDPGGYDILLSVPKAGTEADSIKLFEKRFDLPVGKNILFLTDSFPNIAYKLMKGDTVATTDSGKSRINFTHLIPNVPAVDIYRWFENQPAVLLKANVQYLDGTSFFDVDAGAANYLVFAAGVSSGDTLIKRSLTPVAGRIYTFFTRGWKGKSGTLVPHLSAMIIQ